MMRRFISNIIVFSVLVAIGFVAKLLLSPSNLERRLGREVFEAIDLSDNVYTNVENVILGDSVAYQLFARKFQSETSN